MEDLFEAEIENAPTQKERTRLLNLKTRVARQNIDGKDGIDFVKCPVCGYKMKQHVRMHFKKYHKYFSLDAYIKENPEFKLLPESYSKNHWTKDPKRRKELSENIKGCNNPAHKSKTTKEERKSRSPKCIEFYQKRYPNHTSKEHEQMLKEHIEKSTKAVGNNRTTNIEYWLNKGYSKTEAKRKLKERQAVGKLDNFIKRYGKKEGTKRWEERQEKWRETIKEKYIGIGFSVSKVAIDMFDKISDNFEENDFMYGSTGEKWISTEERTENFSYDFTSPSRKKIIEFNGDYWHMNPSKYEDDDFNKVKKMTAKEIWESDNFKISVATNNNYKVLVIWEKDYRNNPKETIKKCIKFLND